jgi:hypothetical protein
MRIRLWSSIVVALATASAAPADVTVNPALQPAVAIGQPNVVFPNPPLFITSPRLGFYVGIEVPYDIVFAYDNFYLYYGNSWYRSPSYKGPWTVAHYDSLPPIIRKQRIESIRQYRDLEFRTYRRNPGNYRGRQFRPDKR